MTLELEIERANLPPHLRDLLVTMAREIEKPKPSTHAQVSEPCTECPCKDCTMHAPRRSFK